jgi:branched-chain amino acid transport system ATP-binding protein
MLEIKNLNTGYGKKQIVYDVSMNVNGGEIVSIIGPNGAGKSTILKAVAGILKTWSGSIKLDGKEISNNSTHKNILSGLTYSPQGNIVFDELKVIENLELGGFHLDKKKLRERIDLVLEIYPILKKRLNQIAGTLSGGEQQMLALSRALIPEPELLLLDEPSLGLAPNLVEEIFSKLREINKELLLPMLVVEQKVKEILKISDRVYSIKLGKITYDGRAKELMNNKSKLKELFL